VISDQLARPGGHWNHAYPFVTLHQGSYFYGVNSEVLERDPREIDLSSKHEMLAYYDKVSLLLLAVVLASDLSLSFSQVMRKFLASGRVTFLPQTSYQWKEDGDEDHVVKSIILSGVTYHVTVRKKFVNACAQQIKVPSTHVPSYQIDKVSLLLLAFVFASDAALLLAGRPGELRTDQRAGIPEAFLRGVRRDRERQNGHRRRAVPFEPGCLAVQYQVSLLLPAMVLTSDLALLLAGGSSAGSSGGMTENGLGRLLRRTS